MTRPWLPSRRKKRSRSMAGKSLQMFHFESLENRYCMAGDSDVLPISISAFATPTDFEPTNRAALVAQLSNNAEVICPLPAATASLATEVDLCIDNFVGARAAPAYTVEAYTVEAYIFEAYIFEAYTFDAGTLANAGSFDQFLKMGTEREHTSSGAFVRLGNHLWSVQATLRPDVTAVEQLRVGEGEGPSTVTVTPTSNGADASPSSQVEVSIPVIAKEQSSTNRDSSVAAIDWTTGGAIGSPNAELAHRNQLNAQDTAGDPARGLAILSAVGATTPVPSHRYSWTGLQPYRVPSVAQPSPESSVRPHLSALPDVHLDAEVTEIKREPVAAEHAIAGRLISYSSPGETLQRLPVYAIAELPEVVVGTVTTAMSEPSSAAPVLEYAPGDEEGEKPAQTSRTSPPSRLWFLAAITVLSTLPFRRRLSGAQKQIQPSHSNPVLPFSNGVE